MSIKIGQNWTNNKTQRVYTVWGLGSDDATDFVIYQESTTLIPNKCWLYVRHSETLQPGIARLHACGTWCIEWGAIDPNKYDAWARPSAMWNEKFTQK